MKSILRSALALVTLRFVTLQLGLVVAVSLLFAAWLHIPDSGILAVIVTVLVAALILALAFCGEASLLRRLTASPRRHVLIGAIALLVAGALWLGWSTWLDRLNDSNFPVQLAGYANSRFPHSLRKNLFTFENLYNWLSRLAVALKWLTAGILFAIAIPFALAERPLRVGLRVVFSATYWIALAIIAIIVTSLTHAVVEWTPGHGLRIEAISMVLRLGGVAIIDLVLICFVLAVITVIVTRFEARHTTPGGTPETSQPRSVDIP
jgi:hypothetical protein